MHVRYLKFWVLALDILDHIDLEHGVPLGGVLQARKQKVIRQLHRIASESQPFTVVHV